MCFADAKELTDAAYIESLREKVYASLEIYCKSKYPEQTGRFAKLLLRLPALRSIGLKCLEHLFFFKLIGNTPIDQFLIDKLGQKNNGSSSNASSAGTTSTTTTSPSENATKTHMSSPDYQDYPPVQISVQEYSAAGQPSQYSSADYPVASSTNTTTMQSL